MLTTGKFRSTSSSKGEDTNYSLAFELILDRIYISSIFMRTFLNGVALYVSRKRGFAFSFFCFPFSPPHLSRHEILEGECSSSFHYMSQSSWREILYKEYDRVWNLFVKHGMRLSLDLEKSRSNCPILTTFVSSLLALILFESFLHKNVSSIFSIRLHLPQYDHFRGFETLTSSTSYSLIRSL